MPNMRFRLMLVAGCLGAMISFIAFAPIWMRNDGQYMDFGDYFTQYVPFIQELKRMILSGSLGWSWNSFLGDGFINAYSYYTVFNPFAWFVAFFPDDAILYGTLVATILKLSLSMVSSALFFRRFCVKDTYAVIGALLYTFSGFTNVNIFFYFFLDVIAVFPLMMYGLELLIFEQKRLLYIFFVVLNAAINYYFYVSTVLFVILYVLFRLELYCFSSWKHNWKALLRVVLYSTIGTGLAGFALLPCLSSVLSSGKAIESIGTGISARINIQIVLDRLCALLVPNGSAVYDVFYHGTPWASTGAYLPFFGILGVVLYCIQKKDWLSKLCITLTIMYAVPVLNALFALFSNSNYTRWLYGLVFVYSLATVLWLNGSEEHETSLDKRILLYVTLLAAAFMLYPMCIYFLDLLGIASVNQFASASWSGHFMGYDAMLAMFLLTAANYLLLWGATSNRFFGSNTVLWCVVLMSLVNMTVFNEMNYDRHEVSSEYSNQYYYEKTFVEGKTEQGMSFTYRIDHPEQIRNYGLFKNKASVINFNSIQNPESIRFGVAVGIAHNYKDSYVVTPEAGAEYTNALLSVKYYYDYDGNSDIPDGFFYRYTENNVDIYENKNYLPMGFTYDSFCTEEDLSELTTDQRAKAMLGTLVVGSDDFELAEKYLSYASEPDTEAEINSMIEQRRKDACSFFEGSTEGFSAEINLDRDTIVFFSIPNDQGWEIKVNGLPTESIRVNYGLMGICCGQGDNLIVAEYHPTGVVSGLIATGCFLLILIAVEFLDRIRRRRY